MCKEQRWAQLKEKSLFLKELTINMCNSNNQALLCEA